MSTNQALVRRFLHCNYNCHDLERVERWYETVVGLKIVMRTSSFDEDGTPFGIYGTTDARTHFLYDHRGGRRTTSLELVQWVRPLTLGGPYPFPWSRGIVAASYTVPDIDAAVLSSAEAGGTVERRGERWALLRDPEGTAVEVVAAEGPPEALALRVVCSDADRTRSWWTEHLGLVEAPQLLRVPGSTMWPAVDGHSLVAEHGLCGPDDPSFGVVLTQWDGPPPAGPTAAAPFHHGLYRIATAVDDVDSSFDTLSASGVARQPPYRFQLPDTPLTDGLKIIFLRDPDGILVELVERPRHFFR